MALDKLIILCIAIFFAGAACGMIITAKTFWKKYERIAKAIDDEGGTAKIRLLGNVYEVKKEEQQ